MRPPQKPLLAAASTTLIHEEDFGVNDSTPLAVYGRTNWLIPKTRARPGPMIYRFKLQLEVVVDAVGVMMLVIVVACFAACCR